MSADATTADTLTLVHEGWFHLRLQRPLAAWASWQRVLRIEPGHQAATEALQILASAPDLPLAARIAYRFRSPGDATGRERWSRVFQGRNLEELDHAADSFRDLVLENEEDSAAWFNLGLCLAWKGDNREAIEAIDASVALDSSANPSLAIASWTLAEVLRQGAGAEVMADDLVHSLTIPWPRGVDDPMAWLSTFATIRRVPSPIDPTTARSSLPDHLVAEWLDTPVDTWENHLRGETVPRLIASVVVTASTLRFSSPDRESIEMAEKVLLAHLDDRNFSFERRSAPLSLSLLDAAVFAFRLPAVESDELQAIEAQLKRNAIESYYENIWINIPRRGLHGLTPLLAGERANQDAETRIKLAAVVDFREQLSARPRMLALYEGYPFDRLRRRVGLEPNDATTVEPGDIACMSREELLSLDAASLAIPDLSVAERSAQNAHLPEVAARFAEQRRIRESVGESSS